MADIDAGVSALKRSNADVIVSVGGGSPVDASKVMIYRLHQESPETKFLPHIAIPTTLSAAEYTVCARLLKSLINTLDLIISSG